MEADTVAEPCELSVLERAATLKVGRGGDHDDRNVAGHLQEQRLLARRADDLELASLPAPELGRSLLIARARANR